MITGHLAHAVVRRVAVIPHSDHTTSPSAHDRNTRAVMSCTGRGR